MATNFSKNISSIQLNGEKYNIKSIPFSNTEEGWAMSGYVPKNGEIIFETEIDLGTRYIKVGDGSSTADQLERITAPPIVGWTSIDNASYISPLQVAANLLEGSNIFICHRVDDFGIDIGFSNFCGSIIQQYPFVIAETSVEIEGITYLFRLMGNYATNEWECISILSKLISFYR